MFQTATVLALRNRIESFFAGRSLLKNTSWMLAAEGIARISRLLTIVVLGLCLSPVQYGTAMLAIICHDLLRVFTRVGTGAKVIQCPQSELVAFASNAATLQWILCLALTAIQIATANIIADYYGNSELASLLQIMALSNLLYPLVSTRVFLVQRDNNMRYFSLATALAISIENLSTALFALMGLGVMSVAIAKLCSAICWVIMFWRADVTHYAPRFCRHTMKRLTAFSSKILSSELLRSLRLQIDTLICARILSPELFGLYSFAKSAGVGLSQSLSAGYLSSLYPHLCEQMRHGNLKKAFEKSLVVTIGIAGIFLIQSAVAPVYLQLLFGERWQEATLLVSILCLSAIPALYVDKISTLLRAINRSHWEIYLMLFSVSALVVAMLLMQPKTAVDSALIVTVTSWLWLPVIYFVYRNKFKPLL